MKRSGAIYIALKTLSNFLIGGSLLFILITVFPIIRAEGLYYLERLRGITFSVDKGDSSASGPVSAFANIANTPTPLKITPKSTDFGIVIEKINVNAPIVADVDTSSNSTYMAALRYGVAQAKGTSKPDETGNVYLFAHSTLDFWEYGDYASVFTLLHQVEPGDRVVIFYKGVRYDYQVKEKEIVPGFDTTPLKRVSSRNLLTLQTCDPPGTTLRRLIVVAERL